MPQFQRRPCAGWLICFLVLLASGCGRQASAPLPAVHRADPTPSAIELSDPKMTFVKPDLVQLEVKYRFTKGQPNKFYSCDVAFPGTDDFGSKRMLVWEMKSEGVIRDKFQLSKPGAKTFEVQMSEATNPPLDYKKISNMVGGPIQ